MFMKESEIARENTYVERCAMPVLTVRIDRIQHEAGAQALHKPRGRKPRSAPMWLE